MDRILCFKYKDGDFIEALRRIPGDSTPPDQHLSFPLSRWMKMRESEDAVRSQVKELFSGNPVEAKLHCGGLTFIQISSRYKNVQFRQYALPARGNKIFPTKFGVSMSLTEYFYFIKLADEFTDRIPGIKTLIPCYKMRTHSSGCFECYPIRKVGTGEPDLAAFM